MSAPSNIMRFLAYLKPYRSRLVLATVVGVIKYNLPVVFPWVLKDVIDNLLMGRPSRTGLVFNELMGLLVVLIIIYAGITYLRSFIADRLGQVMMYDVRKAFFAHLQRLPLDFFHSHQTGVISSRLFTDVSMAQNFVGLAGTNLFMDITSFASISFMMFFMNWKLGFIAYCTLPVYVVAQKRIGQRMKKNAQDARRRMDVLEGAFHETVSGISEIKSFTNEREEVERFTQRCRSYLEAVYKNIHTNAQSYGATAFLTRLPSVIVIWVGGHLVLESQLTVGALIAFYTYLEMIYNPLNRLSELNLQLANSRAAIDRLFEFFDCEPEPVNQSAPALVVRQGTVCFCNVVFGYQKERPLFEGVNLTFPRGLLTALVGPSGAGKSTLVRLLMRFVDPWQGSITIDGQDIRHVNLYSLRSAISVVQQDSTLFSGTIEDNIRIGRAEARSDEIREAAALANATMFIQSLPRGFDTEIGERGVRLSGGQKQMIAIARAFLKNAPILVLDESTSNVDMPSENLIYEAIERLIRGRTTIVIAHRMSTIAKAERIIVLDRGRILQQGTHQELLREGGGLYRRLYHGARGWYEADGEGGVRDG